MVPASAAMSKDFLREPPRLVTAITVATMPAKTTKQVIFRGSMNGKNTVDRSSYAATCATLQPEHGKGDPTKRINYTSTALPGSTMHLDPDSRLLGT